MQKQGGTLAPSTRPTVQPMHDRTLHGGSTHIPEVFFLLDTMAPQAKTDKRRKNKTKQTPPPQKNRKTIEKTNQRANKHRKNVACLIRNVVAHGFLFGIVDMVHCDLNFTMPWLKTLDF